MEKKNAERNLFVNMTVPTSWGRAFEGKDGRNYVSISVPINEGEENKYYSFIISADRFRTSDKEQGMSYFGFPKYYKDDENELYTIQLKRSERQEDGSYENVVKTINSEELKEAVDTAKKIARQKNIEEENNKNLKEKNDTEDGWLNVPEGIEDEMFSFNEESEQQQQQFYEQQRKAKHGR